MVLHPDKTKFMVFSRSNQVNMELFCNNNDVGHVNEANISPIGRITSADDVPAVKFLGVFFDPSLNFKHHLSSLKNKLSKALYTLRTVKNLLSQKSLLMLYNSISIVTFYMRFKFGPVSDLALSMNFSSCKRLPLELFQEHLTTLTLNPFLKNFKFFLCLILLPLLNYNSCRDSLRTFCLNLLMIPGSVMPFEI